MEIYIAVDSRSFVEPPFLKRGVGTDGYEILLAVFHIFGHVVNGTGIAAALVTHVNAVAEHLRVTENALELDQDAFSTILFRDEEFLAVPADGRLGILPAHALVAVAVACLCGIRKVHDPVVREVHYLPRRVVEVQGDRALVALVGHDLGHIGEILRPVGEVTALVAGIPEGKGPVVVDEDLLAHAVTGYGRCKECERKDGQKCQQPDNSLHIKKRFHKFKYNLRVIVIQLSPIFVN